MEFLWQHVLGDTKSSSFDDTRDDFPRPRPELPASHMRSAIARSDQTIGASDDDRELAFANIKKAAGQFDVDVPEKHWQELGSRPSTDRTKGDRERSVRETAETRKEHERDNYK